MMSATEGTLIGFPHKNVDAVRDEVRKFIEAYPQGETFLAKKVLQDQPGFGEFSTIIVDLAYEEFCRKLESGESVEPGDFAGQFPSVRDQLYRQLLFHLAVADGIGQRENTSTTPWPIAPSRYLHFDLIQLLGSGGGSCVYLAADRHMEMRARVLKLSRTTRREIQSLAKLSHPCIVDVLYRETDAGNGFESLCLPLEGRWTLQQVIELLQKNKTPSSAAELWHLLAQYDDTPEWSVEGQGYLQSSADSRTLAEVYLGWANDILSGLAHAHERGVLHCDVKPSNILIGWDGHAVLLDFDAASALNGSHTSCGGTLAYMAPEQLRLMLRSKEDQPPRLVPATDLYSWAITFCELLCLKPVFAMNQGKESLECVVQNHLEARSVTKINWQECRESGPSQLVSAIRRCSEFHHPNRCQSAYAVLKQLASYNSPFNKLKRTAYKRPLLTTFAILFVLCTVVVLCFAFHPSPAMLTEAGERALAANKFSTAYQYFQRAIDSDQSFESARIGITKALLCQSQYDEALKHLEKLPETDWSIRCRAYAMLSSGKEFPAAISLLKRLIDSGNGVASDYNNAACALRVSKESIDLEQAEEFLEVATQIDPSFVPAWTNRLVLEQRLITQGAVFREDIINRAAMHGQTSVAIQSELTKLWAYCGNKAEQGKSSLSIATIEQHAVESLNAASVLGISKSHLEIIEKLWPRLTPSITKVLSHRERPIVEYRYLSNPALSG